RSITPRTTSGTPTAATLMEPSTGPSQPLREHLTRPIRLIDPRYGERLGPREPLLLVIPDQRAVATREAVHPEEPGARCTRERAGVIQQKAADVLPSGSAVGDQEAHVQLRFRCRRHVCHRVPDRERPDDPLFRLGDPQLAVVGEAGDLLDPARTRRMRLRAP